MTENYTPASALAKYEHEIYDCTRCGFCRVWGWRGVQYVCPTYPHTDAWETQYARGRVRLALAQLRGEVEVSEALLKHAFQCTLCGNCEAHCPVGLPLLEIFHAWREELVQSGVTLDSHAQIAAYIAKFSNPYGPRPAGEELRAPREQASILFYPGCTNARMAMEEVEAIASILDKLGLDWTLFAEDTCCGIPLYEIGQMEGFRAVAGHTLELIRRRRPQTILTSCPSCYQMFKVIFQREEGLRHDFDVQHISEFLLPRLAGRLAELPIKATWHDPCVLGRYMGMYEQPRDLLRLAPGLDLREMESNRRDSQCCGAGGGVFFTDQEVANQTVVDRLDQATAAGAEYLITSCPNCYVRFRQVIRKTRRKLRPATLATLLNEALK